MVNKTILKNKNFTTKEIDLIVKYYKYLMVKHVYLYNEKNIFALLEFVNDIQNDVTLKFVNNYILNFTINKTQKNINIDLLSSSL